MTQDEYYQYFKDEKQEFLLNRRIFEATTGVKVDSGVIAASGDMEKMHSVISKRIAEITKGDVGLTSFAVFLTYLIALMKHKFPKSSNLEISTYTAILIGLEIPSSDLPMSIRISLMHADEFVCATKMIMDEIKMVPDPMSYANIDLYRSKMGDTVFSITKKLSEKQYFGFPDLDKLIEICILYKFGDTKYNLYSTPEIPLQEISIEELRDQVHVKWRNNDIRGSEPTLSI
mgnify:CR=1 FL=1